MKASLDIIAALLLLCGVGLLAYALLQRFAFSALQLKRRERYLTASVSDMRKVTRQHLGKYVKIYGMAIAYRDEFIKSPIAGQPVLWHDSTVDENQPFGLHRHRFTSYPIYLSDGRYRLLIKLEKSNFLQGPSLQEFNHDFNPLLESGESYKELDSKFSITEFSVAEKEVITAVGRLEDYGGRLMVNTAAPDSLIFRGSPAEMKSYWEAHRGDFRQRVDSNVIMLGLLCLLAGIVLLDFFS